MLSAGLLSRLGAAPWFRAPWSPYVVLDDELRIRAVNGAFARADGREVDELQGRHAFEAFPDNPGDPTGFAERARRSVEQVLRTGTADFLGVGRYDVPDHRAPGGFRYKVWMPVNTPISERGCVVGVLHHVQDVTAVVRAAPDVVATPVHGHELASAVEGLQELFPAAQAEAVLGILTDSQRIVMGTVRSADARLAAELARLRLEVRTGRPAGAAGPTVPG